MADSALLGRAPPPLRILPSDGAIRVLPENLAIIVPYSLMRDDLRAMLRDLGTTGQFPNVCNILAGSIDELQVTGNPDRARPPGGM